jgi:transcriptional regulator with XRE-family HTH domain
VWGRWIRDRVRLRSPHPPCPFTLHLHSTPVDGSASTGQFCSILAGDPYHQVLCCFVVTSGAQLVREDLKPFAQELVRLLALRGLSQAYFADLINVSPSAVSNWTNGRQQPTRENIAAAEDILSVPRGHLARYLGYLPVAETPRSETLTEFLERDGQLTPHQRIVLIGVYDEFLRVASRPKGKPRQDVR